MKTGIENSSLYMMGKAFKNSTKLSTCSCHLIVNLGSIPPKTIFVVARCDTGIRIKAPYRILEIRKNWRNVSVIKHCAVAKANTQRRYVLFQESYEGFHLLLFFPASCT